MASNWKSLVFEFHGSDSYLIGRREDGARFMVRTNTGLSRVDEVNALMTMLEDYLSLPCPCQYDMEDQMMWLERLKKQEYL